MTAYQAENGEIVEIDMRRTDQLCEMPDLTLVAAMELFKSMSDRGKGQQRADAITRLVESERVRYEMYLRRNRSGGMTNEKAAKIAKNDSKTWRLTTVSSHDDRVSYGEGVGYYKCPQCGSYAKVMMIQEGEPCSNVGCVECGTALHEAVKNRRTVSQFLSFMLKEWVLGRVRKNNS